ncbi:MAG: hypothetical protein NTW87_07440 [Planctomycetota bacterium]|nr:hypothetical protein [Planctomycetota bacterium]
MSAPLPAPPNGPDAASPEAAARLRAQLLVEQTVNGNPRIVVHSGRLELGQLRSAVFDTQAGSVVIGSMSTIHVRVVMDAGLPVVEGRYLSGFVQVTNAGCLVWETSGALSSFPPEFLPLPLATVLDMIRGTGVQVASHG